MNDKIMQYAPMIHEQTQIDSVKSEMLESGIDFKVEHKDQMMKLIEQF